LERSGLSESCRRSNVEGASSSQSDQRRGSNIAIAGNGNRGSVIDKVNNTLEVGIEGYNVNSSLEESSFINGSANSELSTIKESTL